MEEFLRDINTTYWWLILFVALIVGMIGNFLSDGIRKLYGMVSSSQRERNLERDKEIEEEIKRLVNNPEEITDYQFLATQSDIHSTRNFVLAFMLFIAAFPFVQTTPFLQYVLMFMAIFPYFASQRAALERNRYTMISGEARKRLRKIKEEQEKEEEEIPPI